MPVAPCFISQVKDFPFKDDEVADIWRAAKEHYIDRGRSFEDTLDGLSRDLGMRKEHIAQAFTMPKVRRIIPNDVWIKMQRRRDAISGARQVVESLNDSGFVKKLRAVYNVPRSALTFGHGGVFPVTHMGQYLFIPSRWATFFKTSANAWRFMSPKQYEIAIQRHLADPYYPIARRASRSVDPAQPTVGILNKAGKSRWTDRGFNSLKIARLELFKAEFTKLPIEQQTIENAKPIMSVIDAATGEVHLGKAGQIMSTAFFAPKLIPARFKSAVIDPVRAANTFRNWKSATAGERQAARTVLKNQAQTVAFFAAALAVNQGLNAALGQKDRVNFFDPSKGDWLSFKVAGLSIRPPNALIETIRLLGGVISPFTKTRKELRGEQPEAVSAHRVADYLRYKLHPTIRAALELASGTDLFGRKVPFKGARETLTGEAPKVTDTKPPIGWAEYLSGKGPIPFGGAVRELYDMLREEGMSHPDARAWIRAIAVGALESTGVSAHESHEKKGQKPAKTLSEGMEDLRRGRIKEFLTGK
jgi:hypothetical protein